MGAAVGAALKKIAVAILSDPKNWKKIIGLVLGLIVLVFTPIAVVLVMFQSLAEDTEHIAVSPEVESYTSLIEKYAEQHGIPEYTALIKAIMMQESNGQGLDPMQASECGFNTRYPHAPNSITEPEYSIDVGIQNIASVMEIAGVTSPKDLEKIRLALQGYNYGPGYISWAVVVALKSESDFFQILGTCNTCDFHHGCDILDAHIDAVLRVCDGVRRMRIPCIESAL